MYNSGPFFYFNYHYLPHDILRIAYENTTQLLDYIPAAILSGINFSSMCLSGYVYFDGICLLDYC